MYYDFFFSFCNEIVAKEIIFNWLLHNFSKLRSIYFLISLLQQNFYAKDKSVNNTLKYKSKLCEYSLKKEEKAQEKQKNEMKNKIGENKEK